MESVEVSAKTVDEAIDIALEELGLKRNQVDIEILTVGKPGLFGLGGEQARVRVTALEEGLARPMPSGEEEEVAVEAAAEAVEVKDIDSPEVELAAEHLKNILELAGIDAQISVRAPETPGDGLGRASAVLDIDGEDLGLLIGRRGSTLASLQYVVNLMLSRKTGGKVLVSVDAEHYHRRREESLQGLALRMADRVRQTGRPFTLEPMPAAERRLIHLALVDDPGVATGSVGSGEDRRVVIQPRRSPRSGWPEGQGRPLGR
ncbi:MAG: protein jag [Chloroflexi bacterium]|nr:protein jag [Chloroflexota bacterium]